MTKKLLSIVLALVFCITAVAVPMAVTASAEPEPETGAQDYFYSDFSAADALGIQTSALTDRNGNSFYNVRWYRSYIANKQNGRVAADLVTLNDGAGEAATLLDIKFLQTEAGGSSPQLATIVPVDANGKPFIMEDGATYSVTYRFYVKHVTSWRRVSFGRGAVAGYYDTANGNVYKAYAYDNGPWQEKVTTFRYPLDGTTPEQNVEGDVMYPIDTAQAITLSYGSPITNEHWYDQKFEGNKVFTTQTYQKDSQGRSLVENAAKTMTYAFDNYFAIEMSLGSDLETANPGEIYFDCIEIKKLVNGINLDAGDGLVNGEAAATVNAYAGDPLPAASKDGNFVFRGWYLEGSDTPVKAVTSDLAGKTLYAQFYEGVAPVIYDFDHGEVITTSGDGKTITGSDGVEYNILAWNFQTNRSASTHIGRDGSAGLRCAGTNQTWGVNGLYPLNDGSSFCYLQPATCYTVTMDVKASISVEKSSSFDLVYGPYYSGSVWATDSTKCKGYLATGMALNIDGVEYPDAKSVVHNDDGWDTVTYKFKTPDKFPDSEPDFPLPNILAIRGSWTLGVDLVFDNIKVEKAPAVEFVLENGKIQKEDYYVGDEIYFPSLEGTEDIIYEDGTGYTSSGKTWYKDADFTEEVGKEIVGYECLRFYEKNTTLIPYNTNQVNYFGYESDVMDPSFDYAEGGYESNTSAKVKLFDTPIPVGCGTLEKYVTYKATFFYKSASELTVKMNGVEAKLPAASQWTRGHVTFTADSTEMDFRVMSGSNVYLDTFMVSKAVMASGTAILTDEAEAEAGSQAMRVFFDYVADEDGKTQINGEKFGVTARGVVLLPKTALKGALTKDTEGAVVLEKTSAFDECWEKGTEKLTYSNYISELASQDSRYIASVGFVTLDDGYTYYSDIQCNSVNSAKKAIYYKTNTNTYSLADAYVRSKVVINTRYDIVEDGITFDYTDATLRFNALCQGAGTAAFTVYGVKAADGSEKKNVIFDVFVDGKPVTWRAGVTAKNDGETCVLKFDVGEKFDNHVIEIVRSTERNTGILNLNSFTIHGELGKEEQRAKMVEFIGDSVTCGGCNYETWSAEGTYTYAYRTAQAIGVDYRMVSHSGTGLMYSSGGTGDVSNTWMRMYDYENYVRSPETKYTCEREADLVCIFLGTNDVAGKTWGASWDKYDFKEGAQTLIDKVRACQPNAKIAWVINGMDPGYNTSAQYAIETLTAEGYKDLYVFDFGKTYHNGGNWHPSGDDHAEMAETMIKWFNDTGILDD